MDTKKTYADKDRSGTKLSKLIDCHIPANKVFCELFQKHAPFQLFESLLWYSAAIPLEDSSKKMLEAHYSICQISFFLLQIHCYLNEWETQSSDSNLTEAIHCLIYDQDELENYRDIELFTKFLNLRGEKIPPLVYHHLYDLKDSFLKLAALSRNWDISPLQSI